MSVRLLGEPVKLVSDRSASAVEAVVEVVNRHAHKVVRESRSIERERIAWLTALSLAEELVQLVSQRESFKEGVAHRMEEILSKLEQLETEAKKAIENPFPLPGS